MTDQNPQQGAEPVVLSDTEQDAANIWQEFEEADAGKTPASDAGGEADDFGIPDDDEADKAQVTTDPAEAGQEGTNEDDIWKDAPPAAREAYDKLQREKKQLEHETKSYEGRAAARQSRIAELTAQIEAMKSKPNADEGNPLESIASEYPELSAPIAKVVENITSRQDKAEAAQLSRLEAEKAKEIDAYVNEVRVQTDALKSEHPDYLDVIQKNVDAFRAWVDDQPKRIRETVARNANDIVDAKATAEVIAAFKAHLNPPAPEPEPKPSPNASRRERQIGASASPGGTMRKPVVSGIPEEGDPQAIWDQFEAEDQRKANR